MVKEERPRKVKANGQKRMSQTDNEVIFLSFLRNAHVTKHNETIEHGQLSTLIKGGAKQASPLAVGDVP